MALDAEPHFELFSLDAVHGFHLVMTFGAREIPLDVALVVEQNVFGNKIGFDPWRGGIRIVVLVFFQDPGMLGDDVGVAVEAFLHRGQAGKIGPGDVGMAELAVNRLDAGMEPVAEGDRLLRPDVGGRRGIEQKHEARRQERDAPDPENRPRR